MESDRATETTRLLRAVQDGVPDAADRLLPLVYDELHELAQRLMGHERSSHTLQPTALIHEAWIRLIDQRDDGFDGRAHFLRVASRSMRNILVDHARGRNALKRGGERARVTMDGDLESLTADEQLLELNDALEELSAFDPQLAEIVELRFFGGLKHPEIATTMNTSLRTIERGWRTARAWLMTRMREDDT